MATTLRFSAPARSLLFLLVSFAALPLSAAVIKVPADQPTIQAGINAAATGDTVLVAPGTYFENIDFKGKAITVTSSGGAANTIIDGGGKWAVVTFGSQETRASVLSNLTLRNGGVTNSVTGTNWGGISTTYYSNPTILNNIITQNACNGYSGSGGALLQGNTISGTTYSSAYSCALGQGAGVFIYGGSPPYVSIIGNIIENNLQPASRDSGAILLNLAGSPVIENNIIRNNGMTGIFIESTPSLLFLQNLVYANSSQYNAGGMYVMGPQQTGPPAGIIANNTFIADTVVPAPPSTASQVYLNGGLSTFNFVNNIVVGSGSNPAFLCSYLPPGTPFPPVVIDHNDIYNATGSAYGTGCTDQTGAYGNISADPLFTNPATSDFRLKSGSPGIDAGNTSVLGLFTKDFATNPRLQDATGKLYPIVDMGAYEVQGLADANATTIVLTPSTYQVVTAGTPITLTAKLLSSNGIPTGSVTFEEDNSTLGSSVIDSTGTSTFTTPALNPGLHGFVATYPGLSAFTPAVAVMVFVIVDGATTTTPTTISLTSSANPANVLQPITLTAAVSTNTTTPATGTITFYDGNTPLGSAPLDTTGHTTFVASLPTAGNHSLHAVYSGDQTYATSTSNNISETINANSTFTTLSITPTQSQAFEFFTVTVGVSSTTKVPFSTQSCTAPACTITLNISGLPTNQNSTVTAPILANGTATFRYALAAGTYRFSATFNGSPAFASSTSGTLSETVVPAATTLTLTASPNPAIQNQAVAFTSVLTAPLSTEIPAGNITLLDGSTPFATAPFTANILSNTASIIASISTLSSGTHIITATYSGNANFLPATSTPLTLVIKPNDFTIASSTPNPTIPTEHHLAIPLTLTSIGTFTDQVTLTCGTLPAWATCTFNQTTLQLAAAGTATANLTLDTSSVEGYIAGNHPSSTINPITLALTLPAGILGLYLARRRRLPLRLTLFALTTLATTLTLTGCTGMIPLSTPPGTYTFNITAHGTTTGLTHTLPITLTVTP